VLKVSLGEGVKSKKGRDKNRGQKLKGKKFHGTTSSTAKPEMKKD